MRLRADSRRRASAFVARASEARLRIGAPTAGGRSSASPGGLRPTRSIGPSARGPQSSIASCCGARPRPAGRHGLLGAARARQRTVRQACYAGAAARRRASSGTVVARLGRRVANGCRVDRCTSRPVSPAGRTVMAGHDGDARSSGGACATRGARLYRDAEPRSRRGSPNRPAAGSPRAAGLALSSAWPRGGGRRQAAKPARTRADTTSRAAPRATANRSSALFAQRSGRAAPLIADERRHRQQRSAASAGALPAASGARRATTHASATLMRSPRLDVEVVHERPLRASARSTAPRGATGRSPPCRERPPLQMPDLEVFTSRIACPAPGPAASRARCPRCWARVALVEPADVQERRAPHGAAAGPEGRRLFATPSGARSGAAGCGTATRSPRRRAHRRRSRSPPSTGSAHEEAARLARRGRTGPRRRRR